MQMRVKANLQGIKHRGTHLLNLLPSTTYHMP